MKELKQTFTKRAFDFSIGVIKMTDTLPQVRSSWVIIDQVIRSTTSIGANMVEAKSASSKKDYVNFYTHALKSANESIYWLHLLKSLNKISPDEVNPLINEAKELANILAASILTMKNKRNINL